MNGIVLLLTIIVGVLGVVCGMLLQTRNKRSEYTSPDYVRLSDTGGTPSIPQHPVLEYQMSPEQQEGINPANWGDPIRIPDVAGPKDLSLAYSSDNPGPYPGKPQGVPVPAASLKMTNHRWGYPSVANPLIPVGNPLPYSLPPYPNDYYRTYGPNAPLQNFVPFSGTLATGPATGFVGSVDSNLPFPEVASSWEKAGVLISQSSPKDGSVKSGANILNLYRRPIAPGQDVWEYSVQDKNNFVLKLEDVRYLENGDVLNHVDGKEGLGPWRARIYTDNKWVWV